MTVKDERRTRIRRILGIGDVSSTQKIAPDKLIPQPQLEESEKLDETHVESLGRIKVKVIQAKDLLKGTLAAEKAEFSDQKKFEEEKGRDEQETDLEIPKDADKEDKLKLPVLPGASFLQTVKNWIGKVLLGFVLVRLLKFLPQLIQIVRPLASVAKFIIGVGGLILGALTSLIDWGYKAYDWTRGVVGKVFGEKGIKTFDSISGVLKNVLNLTMGLTLAMIAFSNEFGSSLVDWGKGFMSIFKHGLKRAVPRLLIKMFGKKTAASLLGKSVVAKTVAATTTATTATTTAAATGTTSTAATATGIGAGASAGIVLGAGLLASGLGEGMFQIKKQGQKREKDLYTRFKEKKWWNPWKYFDGAALLGAKFSNFVMGTVGVILDIVGTPFRYLGELIRYPFLDKAGKEKQHKNLAKFDARIREQFREMVNAFSLGMLAKEKGAFGSLFGKKGTKEMGYESQSSEVDSNPETPERVTPKEKGVFGSLFGKKKGRERELNTRREVSARFDMNTGKGYINGKEVPMDEYVKFQNMSDKEQLEQYGKPSAAENKLKIANEQGGAQGVIDSISTTAPYEDGSEETIIVDQSAPDPDVETSKDLQNLSNVSPSGTTSFAQDIPGLSYKRAG